MIDINIDDGMILVIGDTMILIVNEMSMCVPTVQARTKCRPRERGPAFFL